MPTRDTWLPSWFPTGIVLDDRTFRVRHRVLTLTLVAQLPLLVLLAILRRQFDPMMTGELAAAGLLAGIGRYGRGQAVQASAVSLGLTLTAAALVDVTGGQTDMHLDYMVMLALVALYQRWTPFVLATCFVAVQHFSMGLIDPAMVFSSPEAQHNPLLYSMLHAGFVLGMALALAAGWRFSEHAQMARRLSDQRFGSIFDQAPVGIGIVDANGIFMQVNPALSAILGYAPEEMIGTELATIAHSDSTGPMSEQFGQFRTGLVAGYRAERLFRHRDGSTVWARVTVGPLADDSVPGAAIGIVEDLREVKHLEMELVQAQKLEAVGMLAAGIAHEINTPIQFVGDNLTFLSDAFGQLMSQQVVAEPATAKSSPPDLEWLIDEIPAALTQSRDGVDRVATIVGAMRNFGHPDRDEPTPLDIDATVRDVAVVARNEYKYVADLDLQLGGVPPIAGYPSQFHQVVLNLVVNAAHAIGDAVSGTGRRGSITVRTWASELAVYLSVADNGVGMTPEVRSRIFDPFFTTKEVGRGTGQGLTIVHNIVVDKHGGGIRVDSTPGQGTTFTVEIPR